MKAEQMAELRTQLESRAVESWLVRELLAENERLQRDMWAMVSGFRSHLADISSRIGPARRPEDIKVKLEELWSGYASWSDKSVEAEVARLKVLPDWIIFKLKTLGEYYESPTDGRDAVGEIQGWMHVL